MKPAELLRTLMENGGHNPTSLAKAVNRAKSQGQLWRFLNGETTEPRRSTLKPYADHFRIPVDALLDEAVATEIAAALGLASVPAQQPTTAFQRPARLRAAPADETQAAVVTLGASLMTANSRVRKAVAALLAGLAENPEEREQIAQEIGSLLRSQGGTAEAPKQTGTDPA